MMRSFKPILTGAILVFVAAQAIGADTGILCQTITLPAKGMHTSFADLNGNKRFDLLAVDSEGKQLLIYRQRTTGFANTPDQVLELPPNSAWIVPANVGETVDSASSARSTRAGTSQRNVPANYGLVVSTATGLDYYRQADGVFEAKPHPLLRARQVFTGEGSPVLLPAFTNAGFPIISATQVWFYGRNDQSIWTATPPEFLRAAHGDWHASLNGWAGWSMGPEAARTLTVNRHYLARTQSNASYTPENDGIAKLIATLKKSDSSAQPPETMEVDIDGDGRKDLVVWQVTYSSFRTDFYVFLRGADGRLPDRPSQSLHCRGLPIPVNSIWTNSPVADLADDGRYELVLLEPDFIATSIGGLVDMALTRGVKFAITVRSFSHGTFARSGDTAVSFKSQLSLYGSWEWPFLICGDFNGDGRPDLIVKRSATQWEIYYSTADGRWFQPQPAVTFELPAQGYFERRYFEISDLNGDGRADIVSHDLDDPRIFILLTQPENPKGNP